MEAKDRVFLCDPSEDSSQTERLGKLQVIVGAMFFHTLVKETESATMNIFRFFLFSF